MKQYGHNVSTIVKQEVDVTLSLKINPTKWQTVIKLQQKYQTADK